MYLYYIVISRLCLFDVFGTNFISSLYGWKCVDGLWKLFLNISFIKRQLLFLYRNVYVRQFCRGDCYNERTLGTCRYYYIFGMRVKFFWTYEFAYVILLSNLQTKHHTDWLIYWLHFVWLLYLVCDMLSDQRIR